MKRLLFNRLISFKDRSRLCKEDSEENASSCIEDIIFPSRCSSNNSGNIPKVLAFITPILLRLSRLQQEQPILLKVSKNLHVVYCAYIDLQVLQRWQTSKSLFRYVADIIVTQVSTKQEQTVKIY
jgi:hypothetical protein